MNCKNCGAHMKADDKFCGTCGTKLEQFVNNEQNYNNAYTNNNIQNQMNNQNYQNNAYNTKNNVQSKKDDNETACLVCGIMSFFTCWIGFILGIVAIVLGTKVKKVTGKIPAGMICGIISVSIYTLLILVYIVIFGIAVILGV